MSLLGALFRPPPPPLPPPPAPPPAAIEPTPEKQSSTSKPTSEETASTQSSGGGSKTAAPDASAGSSSSTALASSDRSPTSRPAAEPASQTDTGRLDRLMRADADSEARRAAEQAQADFLRQSLVNRLVEAAPKAGDEKAAAAESRETAALSAKAEQAYAQPREAIAAAFALN